MKTRKKTQEENEDEEEFGSPKGDTGLDPSEISFFHALKISTKIVKSKIEI